MMLYLNNVLMNIEGKIKNYQRRILWNLKLVIRDLN